MNLTSTILPKLQSHNFQSLKTVQKLNNKNKNSNTTNFKKFRSKLDKLGNQNSQKSSPNLEIHLKKPPKAPRLLRNPTKHPKTTSRSPISESQTDSSFIIQHHHYFRPFIKDRIIARRLESNNCGVFSPSLWHMRSSWCAGSRTRLVYKCELLYRD